MFSRTLKALCVVVAIAMLSACGSSKTVDPFHPTRVIGLGDGYNDVNATVQTGVSTDADTVVKQIAAYFGQSNVVSYASSGQKIANLSTQISTAASASSFTDSDLVVITVGTHDVIEGTPLVDAKRDLVAAVQTLLGLGVKHVLIMPVLEVSLTPYGRTLNPAFDANATNTFNDGILASLSAAFGGQTPNKVIYANTTGLTVIFRTATSLALAYGQFTDTGYGGTNPACGHSSIAVGNWTGCASTFNANYTTMLFADGIHLTPAGNQWVSQYLYNATASGWR